MNINLSKLNVVLPDGIIKKGEPKLNQDGASVTFTVTGKKPVTGSIGVSYNGSKSVNCKLTVEDAVLLKIDDNILGLPAGSNFTLRAQFDSVPTLDRATIVVPADWTIESDAKVEGNDIVAVYTTKDINPTAKVSVEYAGVTKELTLYVRDPSINSFTSLASNKTEYSVGEDIVLTANYKFNVEDKDKPEVSGSLPEGVSEKTPLAKDGKTFTVTYTSSTPGSKVFSFIAYKGDKVNQSARSCTVTVK